MYLNGQLEVTIADKLLKTVVSVNAKNDGHALGAECDLVVPLNCRIQYQDGRNDYLTAYTKVLFNVGDSITVRAKYVGYDWQTIFTGFVFDFLEGTPMTIKCMDYIYFFQLGIFGTSRVLVKKNKKSKTSFASVGCSFKSITLKDLMQKLVDFVNDTIDDKTDNTNHVILVLPMPDMDLVNITFAMMSPAAILEWIKKELGFNISLDGNQLYVNVASNTTSVITYDTTRNVVTSDLQKPASTFQTYKVKAWFIREDGTKDSYEVGDASGQLREVFFYRVKRDNSLYQKLATEALNKVKQQRYNGNIETYLYPQPILFAKAIYSDKRYPDKNGNYVIIGIDTTIDASGYRHKLKWAYLDDVQTGL